MYVYHKVIYIWRNGNICQQEARTSSSNSLLQLNESERLQTLRLDELK